MIDFERVPKSYREAFQSALRTIAMAQEDMHDKVLLQQCQHVYGWPLPRDVQSDMCQEISERALLDADRIQAILVIAAKKAERASKKDNGHATESGVNREAHDRAHGHSETEWPEPDWSLLDDRRGTLPDFPVRVLSPDIREFLNRSAHGAGVTVDHVIVPLLSIASGQIGAARRIAPSPSWSEPCAISTAIVGFSGTGKTPGLDVPKRVLSFLEHKRRDKVAELRRAHEQRQETAKAAAKKWKAEVQEAVDNNQPAPAMPENAVDPGEFVAPRLYVSDATVERLAMLLQGRPRGVQLIADELAGLFLNMSRYNGGQDREFWLEAWNGKYFVVERMGRPPVEVQHLLIPITGGFQPDKLVRSFDGDDDGLYARFLFGWPQEPTYKPLSGDATEDDPEIINAFSRLIDLPDGEDGTFVSKRIKLSADALDRFEQFRQFLHKGKDSLDGREREWWAKGNTHVLRLAGTLAYLDWAWKGGKEPTEVAGKFMAAAMIMWREYFWPHSRAALRQSGLSDRHRDARRILRWIKSSTKTEVSLKDIRRDALGQKLDADQTTALMERLVKAGWLRVKPPDDPKPGRPTLRWKVNPAISQCLNAETAETAETSTENSGAQLH